MLSPATPPPAPTTQDTPVPVADCRFRALLGEPAWSALPDAVRQRFGKRLAPGEVAVYAGAVVATKLSRTGRLLAQLARVIGAPLPTRDGATGPAVVMVTEEPQLEGQRWVRLYAQPGGSAQMIQSAKRFRGPTGLEEHVGRGMAMELRVSVENGALVFRSNGYFFEALGLRFSLPRVLSPGTMTIIHRQEADGAFTFQLTLDHRVFGRLLDQVARFRDVAPLPRPFALAPPPPIH